MKSILFKFCIIFIVSNSLLYGQSVTLSIPDTTIKSGSSFVIEIIMDNQMAIRGIQAELIYDNTKISTSENDISLTSRSSNMLMESSIISNKLGLILYDSTGNNISIGKGPIVTINFNAMAFTSVTQTTIDFGNVLLADENNNSISPAKQGANISIMIIPVADFSADTTLGKAPLSVHFEDKSSNVKSWDWDFGDGSTATQQDPIHTYQDTGTFTVSLTVSNEVGSDTETKQNLIKVKSVPEADFTGSPREGEAPLTVHFENLSSMDAKNYKWNFGNGFTSNEKNPDNIYSNEGEYTVSLIASNEVGSDTMKKTDYIKVTDCGCGGGGLLAMTMVLGCLCIVRNKL